MLQKLRIKNFCCHKEFEAEFKPGINCIIGSNGAGKSSILNAIYGALTNSYEHPEGTKGVIRQGADAAKIEIEFDGFTITRDIADKTKHLLTIGDQTFRAVKDIENELASRFNLVKAILDKFVFIRQGRFSEIIGLSDSDRAKTLAYLSNVEYFEVLWKRLADEMKLHEGVLASAPTFDEHSIKAQTEELTKEITEATAKECKIREELSTLNETQCNNYLALDQKLKNAKEMLVKAEGENKRLQALQEQANAAVFKLDAEYKAEDQLLQKVELTNEEYDKYQRYQSYAANAAYIQQDEQELATLQNELNGWNEALIVKTNEEAEQQLRKLSELQSKLQMQLRMAQKTAANLPCEVCGAPPAAQFKGDPAAIEKALNQTVEKINATSSVLRQNGAIIFANGVKIKRIQELTQKLQGINSKEYTDNLDYYKDLDHRYSQQLKHTVNISRLTNEMNLAESNRVSIINQFEILEKQLKDSQDMVSNEEQITSDAKEARNTLNRIQTLRIDQATTKTIIQEKQNHLKSLNELLVQLKEKKKQKKLREYVSLLEEVRSLTHRNNIPHLISKRFLNQLITQINAYLEQFEAPFKAGVNDDLSFTAIMDSGAVVPAMALSGGQKCQLAMAFWLSVFQTNGNHIGFLVLDEPGDGLDAGNRKLFNQLLQRTDEIFRRQGQQLLLISHDADLIGNFYSISV